jgi:general secretion pathway protein L
LILKWASSQLLPKLDRASELVVMVPALALSWHRVELPPGLHKQKARLQAALHGLLEERLLDDPAQTAREIWQSYFEPLRSSTPTPKI